MTVLLVKKKKKRHLPSHADALYLGDTVAKPEASSQTCPTDHLSKIRLSELE